eukprot:scaffold7612_cov258-Pinguiococcus_pyrenoidosus.AAC.1
MTVKNGETWRGETTASYQGVPATGEYYPKLLDQGVHSMQYLLRLSATDISLMATEWDMPILDSRRLSRRIAELARYDVVEEKEQDPLWDFRNTLVNGKLSLRHGLSAFQYHKAFFGTDIPVEELPIRLCDPIDICSPPRNAEQLRGAMAIGIRGNCSFIDKARNVSLAKPEALLLLNTDNQLFRLSAGAIAENDVDPNEDSGIQFAVALLTHEATNALEFTLLQNRSLSGRLVPLHCRKTVCEAVLPEEKVAVPYVDSGLVAGPGLERIEFLTSTF